MKWDYVHSHAILHLMCSSISPFNLDEEKRVVTVAIFRVSKEGLFDFFSKVLEADPYLIWARDENKGTTLLLGEFVKINNKSIMRCVIFFLR